MLSPLLCLPGMMCDARLFTPVIEHFSTERPVLVYPLTSTNTIEGLARSILDTAPPAFSLMGLSMGGIVAMEIAKQAPERVERLALLDTNPLSETPEKAASRAPQMASVKHGGLRDVMRDEMKPNYLTDGPLKNTILDLCMDMAMALGELVFISQSIALRDRPDYCDVLSSLTMPTLVLCGQDDELCPVERHELMHSLITGSTLAVIKEAGHLVVLEQPTAACAALQRWLETE